MTTVRCTSIAGQTRRPASRRTGSPPLKGRTGLRTSDSTGRPSRTSIGPGRYRTSNESERARGPKGQERHTQHTPSAGSSERLAAEGPFDAGPFAWAPALLPFAPGGERTGRRALVAILVAWVPLAILSALEGLAVGPTRHESFLLDFVADGRDVVGAPR